MSKETDPAIARPSLRIRTTLTIGDREIEVMPMPYGGPRNGYYMLTGTDQQADFYFLIENKACMIAEAQNDGESTTYYIR